MKEHSKPHQTQVFVCCRERDGKPACGNKGSEALVKELKNWVLEKNLKDKVGIRRSSCLGHCNEGIAICIYPNNIWLTESDIKDLANIQQRILETIFL